MTFNFLFTEYMILCAVLFFIIHAQTKVSEHTVSFTKCACDYFII